jgi:excisionase family DNA binding protein
MEQLLMTTFSKEDFKTIIKECLKEEIGKIKVMPESQKYPVTHLTTKDLTLLFGVSKVTIAQWVKKGIFKAYKLGNKRVYFKKDEVETVLKEHNVPGTERVKIERLHKNLSDQAWLQIKNMESAERKPFDKIGGMDAARIKGRFILGGHNAFD